MHSPKANGTAFRLASSPGSTSVCNLTIPKLVSEVNQELLTSGAIILPGNRDRSGRSVLQVCTRAQVWTGESCTVSDFTCLLGYYYSTLRKERRDQGLTVVIDSRRQQPVPALLSSLSELQVINESPNVGLLQLNPECVFVYSLFPQTEILSSLKALLKHIDQTQLTRDLEGSFHYDHNHWIHFRQVGETRMLHCRHNYEQICKLQSLVEEVSEVMEQQKHLMKCVLDDTRLNRLRLEGGTILARIRKEEASENENYRDTVDMLNTLYNQVDEEVHKLVILSNKSQKQLESLLEVCKFEDQTQQVVQRHGLQLVKESPEMLPGSVNQWMEHCQDYFRHLSLDSGGARLSPSVVQVLQDYYTEASKFSSDNFSSLNDMVLSLDSPQQLQQWNTVWHKCQQTKQQLEDALAQAMTTASNSSVPETEAVESQISTEEQHGANGCLLLPVEDTKPHSAGPFTNSPSASLSSSSHFIFPDCDSKLRQSPSMFDDTDSDCTIDSTISCHSEPVYSGTSRLRKQPMKKIMKKTMSYELTPRDSGHSDASHIHGYTGVYIKGLEVANNVSAEKKLQRPDVMSPALGRSRSMSTPSRIHNRHSDGDVKKQSNKVQHIMDEMISTEREYVRSLSYIIEHYFPEMERLDLPQDLRGKRSIIFGNVEKLWDFHSQYFLKELESCAHCPLSISSCFLRHEDQFGMYALYSKNKPQSDALLCSHGNEFFKNKQVELGDKMDLASYLLKPIQRMSKYALLLKDLIKECSQSQEQELSDLRTAEEMVKFQLRHGNDLLAMDAIRGCDVNLKEQGQLRCQDEFIVWCGRRKYLRHVFLFEDLILFSKTKKIEGGYDIYIYKQSFKTAEIGMTENVGDSGLRFEIWFRRRKSQDTFILQASSAEVKAVWTTIIGKILWRQALRNRELRMQEMVSMGIGSKPFMDIKPSDAAISDRAIDYIMKGSESRTRASIAVPSYEYSMSIKRPHSTISNSSTSSSSSQSSSSLLGSLNLHMYSSPSHQHPYSMSTVPSFGQWPYDCIEEDELEQDTGSQPSMSKSLLLLQVSINAETSKNLTLF
uniref:Pleckstrin homology and RhoGEF domain containing G4B n=1 Tax=Sphaeramia orbicularis TaxID=375764 RepID=A0A672Z8G7_9TELE